jgi:transcriptional antiterminator Rof (Rho-off)
MTYNMSDYIPIDCNFYDELVLLAMHKTRITFIPNIFEVQEDDFIKDLVTKPSKEEFLVLNSGIEIRLDKISNVSDHLVFLEVDEDSFEEE